jgi:hypothetical protein
MGKTVYCISNGSENIFPENTLTSFGNKFPFMYDYGQQSNSYKLQVAVDAIGFSLNFNQQFLPEPLENPCIIIEYVNDRLLAAEGFGLKNNQIASYDFLTTTEDLKRKNATVTPKLVYKYLHFENSVLTTESVENLFKKVQDIVTVTTDKETNVFTLSYKRNNFKFYVNSKLLPNIKVTVPNFDKTKVKSIEINNDVYEIFSCKNKYDIRIDFSGVFSLNLPKIIKVRCENIRDQIFNNTKEKDLLVFCPQIEKQIDNNKTYFFHEFETRTYCTLENTILDHIKFDLVNEFDEALHLSTGVPTLLKLDIIAMEKSKKAFNLRIASDYHNRSKFTVKLPQTLHFNEDWRVNLSSINLPNTFSTFCTEKPLIVFFTYKKGTSDARVEVNVPNKMYTKKDLLDVLNHFFKVNEAGIDIGDFNELRKEQKTIVQIHLHSHGVLGIPKVITDMLGKCNKDFTITDGIAYFHNQSNPLTTVTFEFEGPFNIDYYKPSYIMLYTDFIQPIAVSGVYMNIMKIFPTSPKKLTYVIKEFKKPEYLQLNNYELKEITFQLRNHAGEFINFDYDNHNLVILNLHFSNYTTL